MTPPSPQPPEPALAPLLQMISAYRVTQALYAAASLGVFEALAEGPRTVEDLATATAANAPALGRLLRALTSVSVLHEDEAGRFAATALGERLQASHPESLRSLVLLLAGPTYWQAWGDLTETVRTGTPAFDRVHGEAFFVYLGQRPEAAAIFDGAMTNTTRLGQPAVLNAYDFSGFKKVVDIGGGRGALLRGILARNPGLAGVLADQPAVVAQATELRPFPEATRAEFIGADMFEAVPAGGDAYVLQRILHDWNDAECVQILRNCRRAIQPHGKLLVIDAVLKPSNQPDVGKWTDLNMLVLLTGRERTADEFQALYAAAGFRLTNIIPAGSLSIVEGVPV